MTKLSRQNHIQIRIVAGDFDESATADTPAFSHILNQIAKLGRQQNEFTIHIDNLFATWSYDQGEVLYLIPVLLILPELAPFKIIIEGIDAKTNNLFQAFLAMIPQLQTTEGRDWLEVWDLAIVCGTAFSYGIPSELKTNLKKIQTAFAAISPPQSIGIKSLQRRAQEYAECFRLYWRLI